MSYPTPPGGFPSAQYPPPAPPGTPPAYPPPTGEPTGWGASAWTAPENPRDLRWVPAAHWLPLVSHWVGPLVLLQTVGKRSETVRRAAVSSLNWEITVAVLLAVAILAWGTGAGPYLFLGVVALSVLLRLRGTIVAEEGRRFRYPGLPIVR